MNILTPSPVLAFLPDVGGPEMLVVFFLVLILFGGKRLPELARGLGKSIREFKRATSGVEQELKRVLEDEPAERRARAEKKQLGDAATAAATTAATAPDAGEETQPVEHTDAPDSDEDPYDPTDDEFASDDDAATQNYDESANPYPELRDDEAKTGEAQNTGTETPAIETSGTVLPENPLPESEPSAPETTGQPEPPPAPPQPPDTSDTSGSDTSGGNGGGI
ncbi:MAG: twin-arginine translocase TatA/TatE family subunit [Opitutaceae bacterium]|jgi:sec-independent protein translocase protein TatA|nr:twin-arginine translocase TatA/TatE family subunit [Opitutaceae bacterium]